MRPSLRLLQNRATMHLRMKIDRRGNQKVYTIVTNRGLLGWFVKKLHRQIPVLHSKGEYDIIKKIPCVSILMNLFYIYIRHLK